MHRTQEVATLGTGRERGSGIPQDESKREGKKSTGKRWGPVRRRKGNGKCWPGVRGGATATWRVHQSGEREWGGGRGRRRACWVSGEPPRPHAPHSLTRVSAAAGRCAGRGAASSSRVVLGAGRRLLSLPGSRCVLFFVEDGGASEGSMGYDLNNNSFSFLEVGLSGGGQRAGGPASGDGARLEDRRVACVAGRKTVPAVAGGRSCPSGPASPKPLGSPRRRPAPSRAPARSEQSQ